MKRCPTMACPKCAAVSGDDWRQCHGSCPMEQSPHYHPEAMLGKRSDRTAEVAHARKTFAAALEEAVTRGHVRAKGHATEKSDRCYEEAEAAHLAAIEALAARP